MKISDAWGKTLQVTKQTTGRVVKFVVRFPEDQVKAKELKDLSKSVYKEGQKAEVKFQILDEDLKPEHTVEVPCWLRKVAVGWTKEGRIVETQFHFSEEDASAQDFESLISSIDTDGADRLIVNIEPISSTQMELVEDKAVNG